MQARIICLALVGWLAASAIGECQDLISLPPVTAFDVEAPPAAPAVAEHVLPASNFGFDREWMPITRSIISQPDEVEPAAEEQTDGVAARPVGFVSLQEEDDDTADKARIADLEQRLLTMEKQMQTSSKATSAAKVAALAPTSFPLIKLGGFFQLEAGNYTQNPRSVTQYGRLQNGVGFRRARLSAYGKLAEFTNYIIEMDFATAGRPSFYDVWVEQTNLPFFGSIRAGHFRQPFSLDALTSVRQLQFMERSLPFQAFVPFRRVGVMAYRQSEDTRTNLFYSVFKTGAYNNNPFGDDRYGVDLGNESGYSFSTRLTHLLYYDDNTNGRYLLHVGASYDYSALTGSANNQKYYQASAIPEFSLGYSNGITSSSGAVVAAANTANAGTPRFVSTGSFQANSFNIWGGEVLGQWGPFHAQAEYMATSVNVPGAPAAFYDGAYAQAAWVLTGENRTYNKLNGALDRLIPYTDFFGLKHRRIEGWGAWELAARWSYVDLNDPAGLNYLSSTAPNAPISHTLPATAGQLTDYTTGLNWYLNPYTRMQFNWINAQMHVQRGGFANSQIYALMLQAEF